MLGIQNRDQLSGPVLDEFESLYARLKGLLSQVFDDDLSLRQAPQVVEVPTGASLMWFTTTAPDGFLLCDGTAVSRIDYKLLFDVIGVTYGAGDGSLTYNLPDLRQRFPLGKAAAGTGATLGSTGGNIDHTHTGGSMTGATGATTPTMSGSTANATATISGSTATEAAHTHTFSTGFTDPGSAATDDNLDGSSAGRSPQHIHTGTTAAGSAHSHGVGSLGVDNHSHGVGTIAAGSHTHAVGTLALGATGANNPPYLVVNYIIKT